jgi:hypothetical chaperone protein
VNFLYTPKIRQEMARLHKESHDRPKTERLVGVLEKEQGHRILSSVEETRIALTSLPAVACPLYFIEPGLKTATGRPAFDAMIAPHIEKILITLTECLTRARIGEEKIEMIVLTGGPTETPALRDAIRARFPAALLSEGDRLSSVALGLGYDARRVFGS